MKEEIKETEQFRYSYKAPSKRELRHSALKDHGDASPACINDELKELDKKINKTPSAIAVTVGVIGTLIFGAGLAMCLSMDMLVAGSIVGLFGMAIMLCNYPLYYFIRERQKKKHKDKK